MFVVAVSFFSSNKNLPVIYPFYSEQTHLDCVRWCNAQTLPTYNRNDDWTTRYNEQSQTGSEEWLRR